MHIQAWNGGTKNSSKNTWDFMYPKNLENLPGWWIDTYKCCGNSGMLV